ncbi:MAG: mechanosensitive ion channel family protein [Halobacteriota archaeon]
MAYTSVVALQVPFPTFFEELFRTVAVFLPRLVVAAIILILGWFIGVGLGRLVASIVDRVDLDRAVLATFLGDVLGGTEQAVSKAFGTVTKWFVFAVSIVAAADVLAIPLLSQWVADAVTYLPSLIAGLLVIVIGIVVADFVGDAVMSTSRVTQERYTEYFATGVRLFLYFIVIVVGLSTMGVDTSILEIFAQALAWGFAAAVAIGVGIAVGWGGKDYVSQHIEGWASRTRASTREPEVDVDESVEADGGSESV